MAPKIGNTGRLDRLAKARAARLSPMDTRLLKMLSGVWERARIADLFADEAMNPALYCERVSTIPTDGVCTHCQAVNALNYKGDHYGQYLSCAHCGADYFPDAEPVPIITRKGGRHTDGTKIGEHHADYDKNYRETKRKNAKT